MIDTVETIGTDRFHGFGGHDIALWGGAIALVIAVQAGAVWFYARMPPEPAGEAAPPPMVMVEFADLAMAPETEEQIVADPGPQAVDQDDLAEMEAPEPEQEPEAEPPPEAEPEAEPPPEPEIVEEPPEEIAEPEEMPEPDEVLVEEPLPEPEPEDVPEEPMEEPESEPEPVEEIVPDLVEAEAAEAFLPMPMPADIRERREATPATVFQPPQRTQPRPQAPQQASQQSAPPSVPAPAAPQAAAPQTVVSSSAPNISPQQWQTRVITHLDRHKRYPPEARSRRQQGVPHLRITIDAAGRVLGAAIVRSSGFPLLDQAAIEMANRASPLPAPPASIAAQQRITLTVPVNFNIR